MMINVKEIMRVGNNVKVLVCDMFADEEIKDTLKSNIGSHKRFEVEKPKYCFSNPVTRNIVLFGDDDYSNINNVQFI